MGLSNVDILSEEEINALLDAVSRSGLKDFDKLKISSDWVIKDGRVYCWDVTNQRIAEIRISLEHGKVPEDIVKEVIKKHFKLTEN